MATADVVTDFVEVPEDTVRAQLEHIHAASSPAGACLSVLASHGAAAAALDFAERVNGPVVLDLRLSGPAGETLLSSRGITIVQDRLGVPDVVLLSRTDAELISGGEIRSLDDAQVAVQRISHRGARAVCVKCGSLPARHFETASGDGAHEEFASDLFYDGKEFSLFEAPLQAGASAGGAGSAFRMALLASLIGGDALEAALQSAKRYVSEALRSSPTTDDASRPDFFWQMRRGFS